MTMSTRPKLSTAFAIIRAAPCGSATLSSFDTALAPDARSSATTVSAGLSEGSPGDPSTATL
jgi:hypothetical protein